jgi:hypothetical protein
LDNRSRVLFFDNKNTSGRRLAGAENFHTVQAFSHGPVIQGVLPRDQDYFAPRSLEGESEPPGKFVRAETKGPWDGHPDVGDDRENPDQGRMGTDVHEYLSFRICAISSTSWPGFSSARRFSPPPNGFTWLTAFTYISGKRRLKLSSLAKKIFKSFGLLDWG